MKFYWVLKITIVSLNCKRSEAHSPSGRNNGFFTFFFALNWIFYTGITEVYLDDLPSTNSAFMSIH